MIKKMNSLFPSKGERDEMFTVPKSAQETIPIKRVYKDGIFEVGGRFSKTFRFFDINYSVASRDDQLEMFMGYCNILNSLETDAETKISVYNRGLNEKTFKGSVLMPMQQDGRDCYRAEHNANLLDKTAESHNIIQEKYITISVQKKNVEEARAFFNRVGSDLSAGYGKLSSGLRELTVMTGCAYFTISFAAMKNSILTSICERRCRKATASRTISAPTALNSRAGISVSGSSTAGCCFSKTTLHLSRTA